MRTWLPANPSGRGPWVCRPEERWPCKGCAELPKRPSVSSEISGWSAAASVRHQKKWSLTLSECLCARCRDNLTHSPQSPARNNFSLQLWAGFQLVCQRSEAVTAIPVSHPLSLCSQPSGGCLSAGSRKQIVTQGSDFFNNPIMKDRVLPFPLQLLSRLKLLPREKGEKNSLLLFYF